MRRAGHERETDLLKSEKAAQQIHAVVLTGGSRTTNSNTMTKSSPMTANKRKAN